ncbi:MAG: dihydropteroate synthase [Rikenellaceae bacterium]
MSEFYVNLGGVLCDFSKPTIMSIINITPDSFYEGSRVFCFEDMLNKIEEDVENGALIFDIGGYSSRPNGVDVPVEEEIKRVCSAIGAIKTRFPDLVLSVDTFRSEVIKEVYKSFGAVIVNDITAGEFDDDIINVAAEYNLPYIAMHMRGTPQTMQSLCEYDDVVRDVIRYFVKRCEFLKNRGVEQLILDPGFGFAKDVKQNFEMLNRFEEFQVFDLPLLVGISRKSMIYRTLDCTPSESLVGTVALNWQLLTKGANILRVHDVKAARDVVKLYEAMISL